MLPPYISVQRQASPVFIPVPICLWQEVGIVASVQDLHHIPVAVNLKLCGACTSIQQTVKTVFFLQRHNAAVYLKAVGRYLFTAASSLR